MAVFVDINSNGIQISNVYCRVHFVGGTKTSAWYEIEMRANKEAAPLYLLDVKDRHYTFGDGEGLEFDLSKPGLQQAYADLKHRYAKGLLSWCSAMREESGEPCI